MACIKERLTILCTAATAVKKNVFSRKKQESQAVLFWQGRKNVFGLLFVLHIVFVFFFVSLLDEGHVDNRVESKSDTQTRIIHRYIQYLIN